jgi:hypothetical protein
VRFFTPANPRHAGTLVGELISLASSQSPLRLAVRKTAVAIPVSVTWIWHQDDPALKFSVESPQTSDAAPDNHHALSPGNGALKFSPWGVTKRRSLTPPNG